MHKLCLSHQSWICMLFLMRKRVIMSNTNSNDLIIQFFQFSTIFQQIRIIWPKTSLKPQQPECRQGSSCNIFHKLSENHSLENSPSGEQGLLVAQGLSVKIWWSLRRRFEFRSGKYGSVLRMRPYKPRPRVAAGVARKSAKLIVPTPVMIQPPVSWKVAQEAISK
jgi:hypothetical protein